MHALAGWFPTLPLNDTDAVLLRRHFIQRKVQTQCRNWPPPVDEEGIIQDVLAHVVPRLQLYDASRGPAGLFICRVVDRFLITLYRKHLKRRDRARGGHCDERPEALIAANRSNPDLGVDLRIFLDSLSPENRDLCERLSERPVATVAQEMEISRSTIYRRIRELEDQALDAGLQIYLD
ncbi:hypothetical protein ETAA8_39990 [Anatilimnocola aggregata]|uniref:Sigma-70 family RNA polymerase sigma factor n=1 Tax=Anatilimnocola aggregata TaxID=2528021 RepID=A0A517YF81_9BACT|nr:sigma-70 family RNA polymerase sigma factor [Anatilimnocola aggregata]QDU28893.1 hypothetical protein ETAA8_39990 [Anatilimnocola aggregata]